MAFRQKRKVSGLWKQDLLHRMIIEVLFDTVGRKFIRTKLNFNHSHFI